MVRSPAHWLRREDELPPADREWRARRAGQSGRGSDERVADPRLVNLAAAEGSDTADRGFRQATRTREDAATRIGADRQRHGGGAGHLLAGSVLDCDDGLARPGGPDGTPAGLGREGELRRYAGDLKRRTRRASTMAPGRAQGVCPSCPGDPAAAELRASGVEGHTQAVACQTGAGWPGCDPKGHRAGGRRIDDPVLLDDDDGLRRKRHSGGRARWRSLKRWPCRRRQDGWREEDRDKHDCPEGRGKARAGVHANPS